MDTKLEVLEIGGNVNKRAHLIPGYEEAHILQLDIDPAQNPDVLADAANMPEDLKGRFDGIFASHVLEHFRYRDTINVIKGWVACLKDGGELHIVVPSWEWLAREVLSEKPSPAIWGHAFAGQVNQWDVHLCMFTMRLLRKLLSDAGLNVTGAKTGPYHLRVGDKEYEAEEHYIRGVKGTPELRKE